MKQMIKSLIFSTVLLGATSMVAMAATPHDNLKFEDYPQNCLSCHADKAAEMMDSVHYKWTGTAMENVSGPDEQGKLTNAINTFCINIKGDWPVCGKCHAGRGLEPNDPVADATNVDCLMCHSEEYALLRTRIGSGEGSMTVETPTDSMVQNIHLPNNANCLKCHAYGGGGDGVKRGDIANALATNTDPHYDVHMNVNGANVKCIDCHHWENHKVTGRGNDLRPTDSLESMTCVECHAGKADVGGRYSEGGHGDYRISKHTDVVACQSCHIPKYGKTETETHRSWMLKHDGRDATTCTEADPCPGHPYLTKDSNLVPTYKFWSGASDVYTLGESSSAILNSATGIYETANPVGAAFDGVSMLYPFKNKTSESFNLPEYDMLLPVDTYVMLKGTGNINDGIASGLANLGLPVDSQVDMVTSDTNMLITHGVEPKSAALNCTDCHNMNGTTPSGYGRVDFEELGYHVWPEKVRNCTLCHESKNMSWENMHTKHAKEMGKNCTGCHTTEPTGWVETVSRNGLCNNCHEGEDPNSISARSLHKKHAEAEHGGMTTTCTDCHTFANSGGGTTPPPEPPPAPMSCSDYNEENICDADPNCYWSNRRNECRTSN